MQAHDDRTAFGWYAVWTEDDIAKTDYALLCFVERADVDAVWCWDCRWSTARDHFLI